VTAMADSPWPGDPVNPALGHTTTYTYDDMGRLIGTSSPDCGTTIYGYRAEGTLVWRIDARGIRTDYTSDLLYRIKEASYPAAGELGAYTVNYTYDQRANGKGHLTTVTDPSGSTLLNYDARGRLKEKKSTIHVKQGGEEWDWPFTLSRTFSPAGRVNQLTYPSGRTVTYSRAGCGCRLTGVSTTYGTESPTTILANVTYEPFGGATGMGWGNSATVSSVFDLNGRLATANLGAVRQRDFTYHANGQLHTVTGVNTPEINRAFTYDTLDRLSTVTKPQETLDYLCDKAGNRQLVYKDAALSQTYAYLSGTNRLQTVTGPPNTAFEYDANGNATRRTTSTMNHALTYDQENRLVKVMQVWSTKGAYVYNAFGQRTVKTADLSAATAYFYDFDGNLVMESDGVRGPFHKEYIYGGGSRLAMAYPGGSPVCRDGAGAPRVCVYFYHNDRLGTPELMTDSNKMQVWKADYDAFGEAAVDPASTVVNNFRFPGQYYDAETGLHYNWHRYYDPKTGRYLTPDPIGLAGGINPYVYVENDPINKIDLTGENTIAIAAGAGSFIGGPPGAVIGAAIGAGIGLVAGYAISELCKEDDLERKCEENLTRDLATCSALGKRDGKIAYAICERQAYARYARCLQGSDITPPLPPWGTK